MEIQFPSMYDCTLLEIDSEKMIHWSKTVYTTKFNSATLEMVSISENIEKKNVTCGTFSLLRNLKRLFTQKKSFEKDVKISRSAITS